MSPRYTTLFSALGLSCLSLVASSCVNESDGPSDPGGSDTGAAHLAELLYNPKWYRTLDSTNSIAIGEGTLLFAWTYRDSLGYPDSFYVGIDTLWALPQNVGGDTSASGDWDLQVCPDEECAGGLKAGVHGANSNFPFGENGTTHEAEHHFQFYPAVHPVNFLYTSPDSAIFGGLMYVRSRSGKSKTDTVFGFGAWELEWDTAYPPPLRPVNGYLPRRNDFIIVNGKVRYVKE